VSNIFRDPTEGATARRADLLRRRRDELVMMPHAIRRVWVARRARTASSLAIALLGGAMLAIAAQPAWTQFLARGLPGINPAVLCTLVVAMWIVGVFAYFAARAVDEHRFAVAMSRLVMPGKDVNEDLERLAHENPDQAARDMAHRLEVRSAALPVLAASVLLPVTALYLGAVYRAGGWPMIAEFEASVAIHANKLLACAGAGGVLAIVMTKRAARLPIAAPTMMTLALITSATAFATSLWLVPVALMFAAVGLVVRRLRIERDLLQAEDPAAGSEIFTIRGFIRQLRASASAFVARIKKLPRQRVAIGAGAIAAAIGATMVLIPTKHANQTSQAAVIAGHNTTAKATIVTEPSGAKSSVEPMGDGRLMITLDLVDDAPLDIPALAGMRNVPPMWMARVKVEQITGVALQVSPFGGAAQQLSIGTDVIATQSNCGIGEQPLGLRLQGSAGHYVLYVEPTLMPTDCSGDGARATRYPVPD
jgi:hypothetical protein